MPSLAEQLSIVEQGDTLVLTGVQGAGESTWRVNSSEHISLGSKRRVAIILQAEHANDRWLTVAMEREDDEWTIDDFAAFEGATPKAGDDDAAEQIDPSDIELISIE